MDVNRCIKTRRSTRDFLKKEIKWDKLTSILDSIRYAPSSGNLQNWRVIVVKDKENKKKISNFCLDQTWVAKAPVLIVVCNDESDVKRMYKKRSDLFSIQNCAAGIQNILLRANSLGVASCWIGVYNADKIKDLLKIPNKIKVDAVIALGYAAREEEMPNRLDLDKFVYFDEWGNFDK